MGVAQQRTGTMLQPGLVTSWAFWGPESWPRSKRAKSAEYFFFRALPGVTVTAAMQLVI